MKILDLIIFFLANYGFAYIVTQSVLLKEPRDFISDWFYKKYSSQENKSKVLKFIYKKLDYLITCIICASVWTSFILYFLFKNSSLIQISQNAYDLLIYLLMAPVFTLLLKNIIKENEND